MSQIAGGSKESDARKRFRAQPPLRGAHPDPTVRLAAYDIVRKIESPINEFATAASDDDATRAWIEARELMPAYKAACVALGIGKG